jgi:hypothetical protein
MSIIVTLMLQASNFWTALQTFIPVITHMNICVKFLNKYTDNLHYFVKILHIPSIRRIGKVTIHEFRFVVIYGTKEKAAGPKVLQLILLAENIFDYLYSL